MKRNYTIDALRTVVALFVILLHTTASYMYAQTNDLSFWFPATINAFTHVAVPIFVIISGSFLLGRDEPLDTFLKKRAVRILIPLIFWSGIYLTYRILTSHIDGVEIDPKLLIKSIINGEPYYHLWYLYMLLGLYFATPFLNLSIQYYGKKTIFILALSLCLFATFNDLYDTIYHNKPFFMLWFIPYLSYFLFGYLLKDLKLSHKYTFPLYIVLSTRVLNKFSY